MKKTILILAVLLMLTIACRTTATIQPTPTVDTTSLFPPTDVPVLPTEEMPRQAPSASLQIRSFNMLDLQNGWALANTGVFKTSDGGQTWVNTPLPDMPDSSQLFAPVALDSEHVFVLSAAPDSREAGMLYRTSDGGATWQAIAVPFAGGILHFPNPYDPNNGWVMTGLGVGAGNMGVAIFQTSDGGVTWRRVYTNDPEKPDAGDSLPLSGIKNTLTAYDMQTAFIGGYIPAPGTVYFFATHDGGKTWSEIILPVPPELASSEMSIENGVYFTGNTGYLPVRVSGDNPQIIFYYTQDEGQTWSLLPGMVANGRSAIFFTAAEGFAFDGARFYNTRNSALDWSPVTPNVDFSQSFSMMDFVTNTTGWVLAYDASGVTVLYKTTDGGATWQAQP